MLTIENLRICVIGLGYVGLPLAIEFGRKYKTTGFDLKLSRIKELQQGIDSTLEVTAEEFRTADKLTFTTSLDKIKDCNVYIVSVPTPIDASNRPNLKPLEGASASIGQVLKKRISLSTSRLFILERQKKFASPSLKKNHLLSSIKIFSAVTARRE